MGYLVYSRWPFKTARLPGKRWNLKINVEIDLTPEELKKLYGVPDISKLQGIVIDQVNEKLLGADAESLRTFIKPFFTDGMKAVEAYQSFLSGFLRTMTPSSRDNGKD
jgi:hypothetical protein